MVRGTTRVRESLRLVVVVVVEFIMHGNPRAVT